MKPHTDLGGLEDRVNGPDQMATDVVEVDFLPQ
jgi:hypothetical protein